MGSSGVSKVHLQVGDFCCLRALISDAEDPGDKSVHLPPPPSWVTISTQVSLIGPLPPAHSPSFKIPKRDWRDRTLMGHLLCMWPTPGDLV